MKKKLLLVLLYIFIFTGCWDKKELSELSLVIAIGLDRDEISSDMIATSEVIRIGALQKQGGNSTLNPIEFVTVRGKTFIESRQKIHKQFDRKPFFGHCKVIVISERLAKSGLRPTLDRLTRTYEIRPVAWLVIAKEAKPEDILSINHGISRIQGSYIDGIIKLRDESSRVNVSHLQDFVEQLLSNEKCPTTGAISIIYDSTPSLNNKETLQTRALSLSNTAVFKEDKLIGYLNDKETKGVNWVIGKIKKTTVIVPSKKNEGKFIAIYVQKVKSKIEPVKKDGEYVFNIKVDVISELQEQQDDRNTFEPEILASLEEELEEVVKKEIKNSMNRLQNDLKLDVVGFASSLNRTYPKEWKKVKKDWDKLFPKVRYTTSINIKIIRSGLLQKPIKIE